MRKLTTLRSKLSEERRQLVAHVPPPTTATSRPAMSDLEREAERLDQYYYAHWQSIEALHLQEAFKNQSLKIDHDWHQHESNLDKEYAEKRERLTGQKQATQSSAPDAHHSNSKWHHPEKQSTLIHTAPVIRPVTGSTARRNSGSMSAYTMTGRAANWFSSCCYPSIICCILIAELSRLEREQEEAMKALQKQKVEAKRWLLRQQIRFTVQMDEVRCVCVYYVG
ncbi:hypothetical protein EON65_30805 [archaeon]|nr:MAG: hypothetical protein EON65_30805 [archaeon]